MDLGIWGKTHCLHLYDVAVGRGASIALEDYTQLVFICMFLFGVYRWCDTIFRSILSNILPWLCFQNMPVEAGHV